MKTVLIVGVLGFVLYEVVTTANAVKVNSAKVGAAADNANRTISNPFVQGATAFGGAVAGWIKGFTSTNPSPGDASAGGEVEQAAGDYASTAAASTGTAISDTGAAVGRFFGITS